MKQLLLSSKNEEIKEYTLVSDIDYEHLIQFKWYNDTNYISCIINYKKWHLHRYIMIEILKYNIDDNFIVDHINNIKIDNTRENLRLLSKSGNARNVNKRQSAKSKYFGVKKSNANWAANLIYNDIKLYAMYKIEAAKARDVATKKYFGEYGNLNFLIS